MISSFKYLAISTIIFSPLAQTTWGQKIARPTSCPQTAELKKTSISHHDLIEIEKPKTVCCDANGFPYTIRGKWKTHEYTGQYGTSGYWHFSLNETDYDISKALTSMQKQLATLRYEAGPIDHFGEWYCHYRSEHSDVGVFFKS